MSFIFNKGRRFYTQVGANTTENDDYVPADGETIFLVNLGCSASSAPEDLVCILWDATGTPEVLISSYGEVVHNDVNKTIVGDGTKILRICLTNDLSEPTHLGGFWQGTGL